MSSSEEPFGDLTSLKFLDRFPFLAGPETESMNVDGQHLGHPPNLRQKFLHAAREHVVPLVVKHQAILVGAAIGAASMLTKFALAGVVTTMPPLGFALSAVVGGSLKLAQARHRAHIKGEEWTLKKASVAFGLGAGAGLVGCGGVAGVASFIHEYGHYLPQEIFKPAASAMHGAWNNVQHLFAHSAPKVPVLIHTPPAPLPLSEHDAIQNIINTDEAFNDHTSKGAALKRAAQYALDHQNWKQLASRLDDAANTNHHHYTERMRMLCNWGAKIINKHGVTGKAARHILANNDFMNSLSKLSPA